ncbi:MAG TPA: hypothetical protein VFE55_05375 [Acidimicrobiia bacterium]|nr:hypothetical protein [Acidimicrobiia bacterium]
MGTTATERPQTRSKLARMAGIGPVSPVSILGGLLVGYATFGILLAAAVALLQGRSSTFDLTQGWEKLGAGGGILIGVLLFFAYLLAGYMTGRMAWRQGVLHGIGVFVGSLVVGAVIVAVVRAVTTPKDVKAISDALHSFGIPTTRSKWRDVNSVLPIASVVGMFLGSVLGAVAGERWYTRISRRVLTAEAGEVDVRESHSHAAVAEHSAAETNGARNGNGARKGNGADADTDDIDDLTKDELYQRAQEADIPGRSQMNKEELKEALQKQG